MPLVFVHGVNVRKGKSDAEQRQFTQNESMRDSLFQTISLAGLPTLAARKPINPYWGDLGAAFTHNVMSVPSGGEEAFGGTDEELAQGLRETVPPAAAEAVVKRPEVEPPLLLTIARETSLLHAVDVLTVASASVLPSEGAADDAGPSSANLERARFLTQAFEYAREHQNPDWLYEKNADTGDLRVLDDDQFLDRLAQKSRYWIAQERRPADARGGDEAFGLSDVLEGLKRVAATARHIAKRTLSGVAGAAAGAGLGAIVGTAPEALRGVRPVATRLGGQFFGDVFTYLSRRGERDSPGEIVRVVMGAMQEAAAGRSEGDPLVVVAHSMGGNIVYDILTHFTPNSGPELHVDLLVTVGSQVALFKELRLYMEDSGNGNEGRLPPEGSAPKAVKPGRVGTWINVFDPLDVLGFAAEGVFDGVTDYRIDNRANPFTTHGAYFHRQEFHERLRDRMAENGFGTR